MLQFLKNAVSDRHIGKTITFVVLAHLLVLSSLHYFYNLDYVIVNLSGLIFGVVLGTLTLKLRGEL